MTDLICLYRYKFLILVCRKYKYYRIFLEIKHSIKWVGVYKFEYAQTVDVKGRTEKEHTIRGGKADRVWQWVWLIIYTLLDARGLIENI